jgi:uncharacterized protein (TIGR03083 family)
MSVATGSFPGMGLSSSRATAAIAAHSLGFADAARGNLAAPVQHCPGWSVADLVWHLTEVHWFWGTIVEELLADPPEELRRPARPGEEELLDGFTSGAERLVRVLRGADQSAACWTWAGWRQDVAFVTRHQVQEAAVHHWDAGHARGLAVTVEADIAADSVDEFLHFSVASADDPDEPSTPPLDGTLAFGAGDTGDAWTLSDGPPGTAVVSPGARDGVPVLEAPASDLLLWLYQRVDLDTSAVPPDLLARFRGICFTD